MAFDSLFSRLHDHLLNIPGTKLPRKILVIESDDWGTIRMPSLNVYNTLKWNGLNVDSNPYNRFDSLETSDDLEALYELLRSFKDHTGRHPVVTTNFILGNPDFDRIRKVNFTDYFFEPFTETYKRNIGSETCLALVRNGIDEGLIRPQFHGREHLNALRWIRALASGHKELRTAFDSGVFCLDFSVQGNRRSNLMATLDFADEEEKRFAIAQIEEGLKLFRQIFSYDSSSFIAPCNVWDETSEKVLAREGVRYIQSLKGQKLPVEGAEQHVVRHLTLGMKSAYGQTYFVRNAYFEPATSATYSWVKRCLEKIEAAFTWKKPAIISSHRINYVGSIFPDNRSENLVQLRMLLKAVLRRWPDVEFMSTDELGSIYDFK